MYTHSVCRTQTEFFANFFSAGSPGLGVGTSDNWQPVPSPPRMLELLRARMACPHRSLTTEPIGAATSLISRMAVMVVPVKVAFVDFRLMWTMLVSWEILNTDGNRNAEEERCRELVAVMIMEGDVRQ